MPDAQSDTLKNRIRTEWAQMTLEEWEKSGKG
jgi:hypothetical protein